MRPQPDGSVNVDGDVPIRDLNRALDWHLPDEEATTIAGLVIHEARSIPEPGQSFTFHGFRFNVLRKSRNRITALRIMPLRKPAAGDGSVDTAAVPAPAAAANPRRRPSSCSSSSPSGSNVAPGLSAAQLACSHTTRRPSSRSAQHERAHARLHNNDQ